MACRAEQSRCALSNNEEQPRFSGYSRMTVAHLYAKIGLRSVSGELVGLTYILKNTALHAIVQRPLESVKQSIVTKSSFEAELVALSDMASMVLWVSMFMGSLGYQMDIPIIYQDNQSTIRSLLEGYQREPRPQTPSSGESLSPPLLRTRVNVIVVSCTFQTKGRDSQPRARHKKLSKSSMRRIDSKPLRRRCPCVGHST